MWTLLAKYLARVEIAKNIGTSNTQITKYKQSSVMQLIFEAGTLMGSLFDTG
jgi:hypothetical protein